MTQHEARPALASGGTRHRSLTGKPAPEVVRVFGLQPVATSAQDMSVGEGIYDHPP